MKADFTDIQKNLFKGHKAAIAKKHGCATMYVALIAEGKRNIDSDLAKKIYSDLQKLAELLTPENEKK